ncbi:MAG: hypothetical protein ACR2OV_18050 [Hyphomicrobiaceae bacterium]
MIEPREAGNWIGSATMAKTGEERKLKGFGPSDRVLDAAGQKVRARGEHTVVAGAG